MPQSEATGRPLELFSTPSQLKHSNVRISKFNWPELHTSIIGARQFAQGCTSILLDVKQNSGSGAGMSLSFDRSEPDRSCRRLKPLDYEFSRTDDASERIPVSRDLAAAAINPHRLAAFAWTVVRDAGSASGRSCDLAALDHVCMRSSDAFVGLLLSRRWRSERRREQ